MSNTAYLEQVDCAEEGNFNGSVAKPWGREGEMFALGHKNMNMFVSDNLHGADPAFLLEEMEETLSGDTEETEEMFVDESPTVEEQDVEYIGIYDYNLRKLANPSQSSMTDMVKIGLGIISQMLATIEIEESSFGWEATHEMQFGEVPAIPFDNLDDEANTKTLGMSPTKNGIDEPRRWTRNKNEGRKYPYKNRKGRPTIRRSVEL